MKCFKKVNKKKGQSNYDLTVVKMFDFTSGMILTRKEEDDNDMTKPRGSHIHSFM